VATALWRAALVTAWRRASHWPLRSSEREVVELGDDDAVLVVRREEVGEKIVVFEPRDEDVVGLGVPLVPVGHGRAEAVERRPLQTQHDAEEARGVDGGEEGRAQEEFDHGRDEPKAQLRIRGDSEEVVVERGAFGGAERVGCVEAELDRGIELAEEGAETVACVEIFVVGFEHVPRRGEVSQR
jgi:hypothetical protein